ncbi:hypothetical protein [Nocardia sp. AG03]|uniref:hypothetical protein n=1 Tax=Nocardia sp. AG03 TaxID=3025312 RepID=UPI00241873B7|nr:hypothetical protein [Nocardia sp. AG03]
MFDEKISGTGDIFDRPDLRTALDCLRPGDILIVQDSRSRRTTQHDADPVGLTGSASVSVTAGFRNLAERTVAGARIGLRP